MDLDFLCLTLITLHGHAVLAGVVQDNFLNWITFL